MRLRHFRANLVPYAIDHRFAASAALMVSACPSEGDHPYPCFAARSLNGAIADKTKRQPKPLIAVLILRPKLANSWKGPLDADALERQRG
jgi:hypothetical protein